jgi:hypothetical protein
MNDRIKSLLAKAHLDVMEDLGDIDSNHVAEKFAELLVEDVLGVCDQVNKNFEDWTERHSIDSMQRQIGVNHCRLAIKEHFGINK